MNAKALTCPPSIDRRIHRASTTAFDVLSFLCPIEDAFGAGVALHHALIVIIGVVGQRLDGKRVAELTVTIGVRRLAENPQCTVLSLAGM